MNNPWMQLASSTLGMLGGNSMGCGMGYGLGSFGGLTGMGCSNIFTDCYGEPNYDAMAGWGVANAVIGVGLQAWQSHQANKEPEVNYSQEIRNINQEIDKKAGEVNTLETDNTTQQNTFDEAGNTITTLNTDLKNAKTAYDNAAQAWYQVENADPKPENYGELKLKFENAKKEKEELEGKIKAQEEIQEAAKKAIEANNTKKDTLNQEIEKLKEQKLEYEREIAKKGGEDCLKTGFYNKETNPANKKQIQKAADAYIKAEKENNTDDMKKYADIFIEMYKSNKTEFKSKYETLYNKLTEE